MKYDFAHEIPRTPWHLATACRLAYDGDSVVAGER
jgi:hypothetical protein